MKRALFLDRDGTLVHARHYPSRPEELIVYDGILPWLRMLQEAGFLLVVVTNQSGIARGMFGEQDLTKMHDYLRREFAASGVSIDRIEHCPHHPDGVVQDLAITCDCRKPQPGMVLRAAHALEIDPARSWFIGDILDDVEAGNRADCTTILVDLGTESLPRSEIRRPDWVARDTVHALRIVAAASGLIDAPEAYAPVRWSEPAAASENAHVA